MRVFVRSAIFLGVFLTTLLNGLYAQRGGDWMTVGNDAQRSFWVRRDAKISPETMRKPGFELVWKMKLKNEARQLVSVTPPVLFDFYISYRGFRSLGFVGGSSGNSHRDRYRPGTRRMGKGISCRRFKQSIDGMPRRNDLQCHAPHCRRISWARLWRLWARGTGRFGRWRTLRRCGYLEGAGSPIGGPAATPSHSVRRQSPDRTAVEPLRPDRPVRECHHGRRKVSFDVCLQWRGAQSAD